MRKPWSFMRCTVFASAALLSGAVAMDQPAAESAANAQPKAVSFTPPLGALIAPGRTPDLDLLYTGNVIGYLDPCG